MFPWYSKPISSFVSASLSSKRKFYTLHLISLSLQDLKRGRSTNSKDLRAGRAALAPPGPSLPGVLTLMDMGGAGRHEGLCPSWVASPSHFRSS